MPKHTGYVVAFRTRLGWMAVVGAGRAVKQLAFGHRSRAAALAALDEKLLAGAVVRPPRGPLVGRLRAYAGGEPIEFLDVPIDPGPLTDFQRRVLHRCRRIRYGRTLTYGRLAAEIGRPRAARAVGRCMAANRVPLIVPCHRVVPAGGGPGAFSAPGGTATKRRLLAMEARKRASSRRRSA